LKKENIFNRHPKLFLTGIIIFSIFTLDLTLTWSIRKLRNIDPKTQGRLGVSSKIYHHDLPKNYETKWARFGPRFVSVYTNNLGFRDFQTRNVQLSAGKRRILLMGDSFTEGIGTDYEGTWAGIFTRKMAGEGVDVLNAGVSSYSPIIYLRKTQYLLEELKLKFNEVILFLDLSDIEDETLYAFDSEHNVIRINDEYTTRKRSEKYNLSFYNFKIAAVSRFSILSVLYSMSQLINPNHLPLGVDEFNQPPFEGMSTSTRARWTMDREIFAAFGKQGLETATIHMNQLAALLKKNSIPLTIVVYPWPDQIYERDTDSIHVKHWSEWAKLNSVAFIDLFPAFLSQPGSNKDVILRNYIFNDIHWNAAGNALAADELLKHFP